jgi:hypothetical protein
MGRYISALGGMFNSREGQMIATCQELEARPRNWEFWVAVAP